MMVPLFLGYNMAVCRKLINFLRIESIVGLISHLVVINLSTFTIASANAYFSNSMASIINGDVYIYYENTFHYTSL